MAPLALALPACTREALVEEYAFQAPVPVPGTPVVWVVSWDESEWSRWEWFDASTGASGVIAEFDGFRLAGDWSADGREVLLWTTKHRLFHVSLSRGTVRELLPPPGVVDAHYGLRASASPVVITGMPSRQARPDGLFQKLLGLDPCRPGEATAWRLDGAHWRNIEHTSDSNCVHPGRPSLNVETELAHAFDVIAYGGGDTFSFGNGGWVLAGVGTGVVLRNGTGEVVFSRSGQVNAGYWPDAASRAPP